ncbi:MAG TPA: outer membrane lipid asymmetry maintenance protein MlaD [Burkholderiales bacterium]|nr:outer membrane lipid asymmetry maintenance protein MlaD [Burkholderiales bacterium]
MERSTIDVWVGAFVIMGFGALLVLALKVGNLGVNGSQETYSVTAPFNNIGGLKVRAPVRASGVTVGRVVAIEFDTQKYEANVKMAIDKSYQFPKDTTASILTSGILGENYIGLDAGGEDDKLKEGDRIALTQSAVVLERLISQFMYGKAQESASPNAAPPAAPK